MVLGSFFSKSTQISPIPKNTGVDVQAPSAGTQDPQQFAAQPAARAGVMAPSQVVIDAVKPEIDAGRFAIKRVLGDDVVVDVYMHSDSHIILAGVLNYRFQGETQWQEVRLTEINHGLDWWQAQFSVNRLGRYEYTVQGWVDEFGTWQHGFVKKVEAQVDVTLEREEGARLFEKACKAADKSTAEQLESWASWLRNNPDDQALVTLVKSEAVLQAMFAYGSRQPMAEYGRVLTVQVDPKIAACSNWYELFPRSCSPDPNRSGTLRDVITQLPRLQKMAVDVLYLPPIHPIGRVHRKGPNNTLTPGPNDPGSPWAIGAKEGGHDAIHPELGTIEDFKALVNEANKVGIKIALDIAFQAAPDHPWVKEHPEWFIQRPDGSIQYAENPPKKYQDIYPLYFGGDAWMSLWEELKRVVLYWVDCGVVVFRVDNPHTKPYAFWEWLIAEVKKEHPEVIFLAEAFTRPKVMHYLAKLGFSQSYTYFTWRNQKQDLTEYLTELTSTPGVDYFRPNFFANTPDILNAYLQHGGPNAFKIRLALAATLSPVYGIYGPGYELCDGVSLNGSEEYLNSEKFQVRHWDIENTQPNITDLVCQINAIRKNEPALQQLKNLRFLDTSNDEIIAYYKWDNKSQSVVLAIVNVDPHNTHWTQINMTALKQQLHRCELPLTNLLTQAQFTWHGDFVDVTLDPHHQPFMLLKVG